MMSEHENQLTIVESFDVCVCVMRHFSTSEVLQKQNIQKGGIRHDRDGCEMVGTPRNAAV